MNAKGEPTTQEPAQLTREDHEKHIKMMDNFLTALRAGTFPGHSVEHITVLLEVIKSDRKSAVAAYEAASLKHHEWKEPAKAEARA
jgi:hypothetical protein